MKKVLLIFIAVISAFMINISPVFARQAIGTSSSDSTVADEKSALKENCPVFGDPNNEEDFAFYLQVTFNVIKFLGPVLVFVMTIIDLVKVTAEQKQDGALQKLGGKTLKRLIYAALIFVIPTIINSIFSLIGLYGTCGIS